jgi:hypothetical protein
MSLLPLTFALNLFASWRAAVCFVLVVSLCAVLVAARGLRRDRAYKFFPAYSIFYAPLWMLERALSVYWAIYWRTAHGGYPFGDRVLSKGTGRAWVAGGRMQRQRAAPERTP